MSPDPEASVNWLTESQLPDEQTEGERLGIEQAAHEAKNKIKIIKIIIKLGPKAFRDAEPGFLGGGPNIGIFGGIGDVTGNATGAIAGDVLISVAILNDYKL